MHCAISFPLQVGFKHTVFPSFIFVIATKTNQKSLGKILYSAQSLRTLRDFAKPTHRELKHTSRFNVKDDTILSLKVIFIP